MELYKKRAELRAFLEIILSVSAIIIFSVFALKPTVLTIINLTQQIKEKRSTLNALNLKINNLETASTVFADNQNIIPDIDSAVSTSPKPEVFVKQIRGFAAKDSVAILGFSMGEVRILGKDTGPKKSAEFAPLPGGASEMPFSVSIKGDYASLLAFIQDFEKMRVVSKIDNLSISSSPAETGEVIVVVIGGRVPYVE